MIGSFMGVTFTVSDKQILTINGLAGTTGGDFASHDRTMQKARGQFIAPKLKTYKFDIRLRAQDGNDPRRTLEHLQGATERGDKDYLIIGSRPISDQQFLIKELSDAWDAVILNGILTECTISLSLEECLKPETEDHIVRDEAAAGSPANGTASMGTSVNLNNAPFYYTSTAGTPSCHKTGTYYFYDGENVNGRFRMTNLATRCGKKPVGQNVTGWVPAEYCGV